MNNIRVTKEIYCRQQASLSKEIYNTKTYYYCLQDVAMVARPDQSAFSFC